MNASRHPTAVVDAGSNVLIPWDHTAVYVCQVLNLQKMEQLVLVGYKYITPTILLNYIIMYVLVSDILSLFTSL